MHRIKLFVFLFSISFTSLAQINVLDGFVFDSISKEPMAFVHIIFNNKSQGTSTNIDGRFQLNLNTEIQNLKFSFIGYETKTLTLKELKNQKNIVYLSQKTIGIQEVLVLPGENPAHRIINKVIENKDTNNPEKNVSFSYDSYSKMYFTVSLDSVEKMPNLDSTQTLKADSSLNKAKDFINKQHLFMIESVSERKYKLPDKNSERVIGSRVSGMSNPMFTILNTQLQSFSIYDEYFKIYDKMYLSPVSKGSTNKYFFLIEDTMYNNTNDTIFIISFRPSKNRNFDGLKGVLHINSNHYAIENVSAEPFEKTPMHVRVQQKYDLVENKQWFPVELNTELKFNTFKMEEDGWSTILMGVGKTYISAININPELSNKMFDDVTFSINEDAHKMQDTLLEKYRITPLSERELRTYHIIDSIGKAEKFETKLKVMGTLMRGYIPFKIFNLDYTKFIDYNHFFGYRLGAGLETNDKLVKFASIGGYLNYGTKDNRIKASAHLKANISKRYKTEVKAIYEYDVAEAGGVSFIDKPDFTSTEIYRIYLIEDMYYFHKLKLQLQSRFLQHFTGRFFTQYQQIFFTDDYNINNEVYKIDFTHCWQMVEVGMNLRFQYKEKFIETPFGLYSEGSKYPILYVNLTKGLITDYSDKDYLKIEAQLTKVFTTKAFGKTKIRLKGGFIDKELPYQLRYFGNGSYRNFPLDAEYSFGTMYMNEFVSDKFVTFNFKQDFGNLLFKNNKMKQGIALIQNIGYGWTYSKLADTNLKSMEKGYFESGILLNNLIRLKPMGYGIGVYYRYGEYSFSTPIDNFAFKLTMNFSM